MNPWDKAAKRVLWRPDTLKAIAVMLGNDEAPIPTDLPLCELERGVNYFVLALEEMGARTLWSCEGHPNGFYVVFLADYSLALNVSRAGYFKVEVDRREDSFTIRLPERVFLDERHRQQTLRWAALAWESMLFGRSKPTTKRRKNVKPTQDARGSD